MSGYFQQWCDDRGIELEQVETAHLMVYMVEARRRGAPKGPVSVRWLRTTFTVVKRESGVVPVGLTAEEVHGGQ